MFRSPFLRSSIPFRTRENFVFSQPHRKIPHNYLIMREKTRRVGSLRRCPTSREAIRWGGHFRGLDEPSWNVQAEAFLRHAVGGPMNEPGNREWVRLIGSIPLPRAQLPDLAGYRHPLSEAAGQSYLAPLYSLRRTAAYLGLTALHGEVTVQWYQRAERNGRIFLLPIPLASSHHDFYPPFLLLSRLLSQPMALTFVVIPPHNPIALRA